jgi:hypothetical protein
VWGILKILWLKSESVLERNGFFVFKINEELSGERKYVKTQVWPSKPSI